MMPHQAEDSRSVIDRQTGFFHPHARWERDQPMATSNRWDPPVSH